ncbi:hypothetical protein [Asticcacaulis benevestitus]|uniref:Uncharacterized protein n=1 Tax=Asticcacaulis benevestitus DSM 16100 = ATCC BAA-896 TaxID=1121022 RepID=V4PSR5_9CAUL|nr:hypothetical protein [Asticcacaulis benevestitus]ESQ90414.1 hypothetical protein ABENE_12555 [Asticcacaulis benevestitus DSM 16100 = ATCC BAA-896]
MKLQTFTCLLALALTAQATQSQETAPPDSTTVVVRGEKAGTPHHWLKAESPHFTVYSDTSRGHIRDLLENLERFRYVLYDFSHIAEDPAGTPKLTLYYTESAHDLAIVNPEMPERAVGLYETCEDGVQGFAVYQPGPVYTALNVAEQMEDEGQTLVFQAYARHFFRSHFSQRAPLWYIEGYARYVSTMRFEDDAAILGLPPYTTAAYLRNLDMRYPSRLDYKDVLNDNDWFSGRRGETGTLQNTVAQKRNRQRVTDKGPAELALEDNARLTTEFASRAWLLTHWILSSPERAQKLAAYDAALQAGDNRVDAFGRLFGSSAVSLDVLLRKYLLKALKPGRMTIAHLPLPDVSFDDLPASAEKQVLEKAALQGCPSIAHGRHLLGDLRSEAGKQPDSFDAQMTLSRSEILYGDARNALPWLQKATLTHPDDFEGFHLLGRAELKLAETTQNADAFDAAEAALTRAAELNPNSASNAFWYYRAKASGNDHLDADAAGAAVLAWRLAPEVDTYVFHAALVHAESGDVTTATQLMTQLAHDPRPGRWAKPAKDWLARLKAGASKADLLAAIAAPDKPDSGWAGQADWTLNTTAVLNDVLKHQNEDDKMRMQSNGFASPPPNNAVPQGGQVMPDASQEKIGER